MRALYAFIFAIAVLWAVPRNARAQVYVTRLVSENQSPAIVTSAVLTPALNETTTCSQNNNHEKNLDKAIKIRA